jgi:uncharacterized protein
MTGPEAQLWLAAELRPFLRPALRSGPVRVRCDGVSSLGHVVESLGVPLTEVGTLTANQAAVAPGYRPGPGDEIRVAAVARPQPLPSARFVLDVHLGTLARRLRLVGIDVAYSNDAADDALIEQANATRRVLLTQDRGLLRRRRLWLGAFVRGARPDEQFADVLDRFAPPLAPWTRCPACNGLLRPAAKAGLEPRLMPGTRRTYTDFAQCAHCGQVYWHGAHSRRLEAIVTAAVQAVAVHAVAGAAGSGAQAPEAGAPGGEPDR